jgi:hypothetical protein
VRLNFRFFFVLDFTFVNSIIAFIPSTSDSQPLLLSIQLFHSAIVYLIGKKPRKIKSSVQLIFVRIQRTDMTQADYYPQYFRFMVRVSPKSVVKPSVPNISEQFSCMKSFEIYSNPAVCRTNWNLMWRSWVNSDSWGIRVDYIRVITETCKVFTLKSDFPWFGNGSAWLEPRCFYSTNPKCLQCLLFVAYTTSWLDIMSFAHKLCETAYIFVFFLCVFLGKQ